MTQIVIKVLKPNPMYNRHYKKKMRSNISRVRSSLSSPIMVWCKYYIICVKGCERSTGNVEKQRYQVELTPQQGTATGPQWFNNVCKTSYSHEWTLSEKCLRNSPMLKRQSLISKNNKLIFTKMKNRFIRWTYFRHQFHQTAEKHSSFRHSLLN